MLRHGIAFMYISMEYMGRVYGCFFLVFFLVNVCCECIGKTAAPHDVNGRKAITVDKVFHACFSCAMIFHVPPIIFECSIPKFFVGLWADKRENEKESERACGSFSLFPFIPFCVVL